MTLPRRLREALTAGHARDIALLEGDGNAAERPPVLVPAAVLVPITARAQPTVILTQRPDSMRKHPGQVAFPGGRVDDDDVDLVAAALREAEEEIALPRHMVDVIGATDRYRTITGYDITPIIGVVPSDVPLHPNENEVAAIFEVPLAWLLDPANHQINALEYAGRTRRYYEMFWEDRRIWGATAAMIVNLSKRISWPL